MISCICLSCNKYHQLKDIDLMKNPSYIHGRLFLTDTLTQSAVDVPQSGKKITISLKDPADPLNFIYSTTTDAEGYFSFENVSADLKYRVSYSETIGGKLYGADSNGVGAPSGQLALTARLLKNQQKGVVFTVTDSLGKKLAAAEVCLFTTPLASGAKACDGSNYSVKTDPNGRAPQFGLNSDRYYVLAKSTINGVFHIFRGSVVITNKVEEVNVVLRTEPAPVTNGLKFLLTDEKDSPLGGARICLFNSKVLFDRDTCEASNYSLITGPAGKASISDIPAGKYYILGEVALKDFKLIAKDSVVVGTAIQELKLTAKKK